DRHEGEVVPLNDREETDQKDLVGQGRRRDDGEREIEDHRASRVSDTKRTASIWRDVTCPSVVFSTRVRNCGPTAVPPGTTMQPPGFSCCTRGGGTWPAAAVTRMASKGP